MPRAKKVANKKANKAPFEIVPSKEIQSKRLFSNFVRVSHSVHEFTLTFCDIPPMTADEREKFLKSKKREVAIQAEIIIPPTLVESLIGAITANLKTYKSNFVKEK